MSETAVHDSPESPAESMVRKSYWGLVNTVNDRLSHLSPAARHNVTAVHFKLSDSESTGLTDVTVGRTSEEGMVPVTLHGRSESGEAQAMDVHLRPEAASPVPSDYYQCVGLIHDYLLDVLETAEATATVMSEITL